MGLKMSELYLDEKDRVVIPMGLDKRLLREQLKGMTKLAPPKSQWKTKFSVNMEDTFSEVIDGVEEVLSSDQGTSIPYISAVTGNFLINPCPVSMSTFNKMVQTDPVINRCVGQNITTIVQGIGEYHHEDKEAQRIGREALKHLNGGVHRVVEMVAGSSIVNGMFAGFIDKDKIIYGDDGCMYPTEVKQMPPLTVQFTADNKGGLKNVFQYVYNFPYAGTQNALSTMGFMPGYADNMMGILTIDRLASLGPMDYPFRTNFIQNFGLVELDRRFVLHHAMEGHYLGVNPYGISWLFPIYNLWIMKQLCKELYVSAQSRVAHPMLVGYANHQAKIQVGDSPEEVVGAVEALYEAMKDHREDSALILTGLKGQVMEIDVVHSEGDFSVFEKALEYYDKKIEIGLKVPAQSYESNQSYAGVTAQGSMYMKAMAKYRKDIVDSVVLNQFMRWVLKTNYDPNINEFGRFDVDIIDIDDRLKYAKLYSQMQENGFVSNLNPTTIKIINKQMGLPELDDDQMELLIKENMFKLITGGKKKGGKKDTSKKKDLSDTKQHYKSQSMENEYKEAANIK